MYLSNMISWGFSFTSLHFKVLIFFQISKQTNTLIKWKILSSNYNFAFLINSVKSDLIEPSNKCKKKKWNEY